MGVLISPYPDQEGNKLQRQKILSFIYPIYNHNWRNISAVYVHITRLASNEIFSPSNKIYREVDRAKDLSAHWYMPPAGFEPAFEASEGPQTHALCRATTGILQHIHWVTVKNKANTFTLVSLQAALNLSATFSDLRPASLGSSSRKALLPNTARKNTIRGSNTEKNWKIQ